jgi:hypothetical protein
VRPLPVYGGGTANAEFEMLTGLPSNSRVLSGTIYQEYASQFKSGSDTIASVLRQKLYYLCSTQLYKRILA